MSMWRRFKRQHWWLSTFLLVALVAVAARLYSHAATDPEIALVIGEPYEDMRKRSSAKIDPAIPGHFWGNFPKTDARLRFIDPQYGFLTPIARFFTVTFEEKGLVNSVSMSPQIEPLLLDDALKIALDLQEQWRKSGWKPIRVKEDPPFADTPEWRDSLKACKSNAAYWQAGAKYQTLLTVACFKDDKHPNEKRYLITLELAKPWME